MADPTVARADGRARGRRRHLKAALCAALIACASGARAPAPPSNRGGAAPPPPPRRYGLVWVGPLRRETIHVTQVGPDELVVTTDVAGAEVLLDRVLVGLAPVRVHLPPGDDHHLTVRLEGY